MTPARTHTAPSFIRGTTPECIREPQQWESSETFSTEESAMTYYKVRIRPELTRLMSDAAQKEKGGTVLHRRLE